jgi:hypothetical protein
LQVEIFGNLFDASNPFTLEQFTRSYNFKPDAWIGDIPEMSVYRDSLDHDVFLVNHTGILDKIIESRVRFVNLAFTDPKLYYYVAQYFYDKGLRKGDLIFAL